MEGLKILLIILGGLSLILSLIEIFQQKIELLPILVLCIIGISFVYIDADQYTTSKTVLSGIVKEKYISHSKISSFYKTTIEISDKDSKYIVTIDDSLAFDNNVIGSKIYVEKKDIINKKTNSILETNYKYISNAE